MKGRIDAPSQELEQVVSEYEFLVSQMRQAVWRLDATGKVIEANTAASRWLEASIVEIVGKKAGSFLAQPVDLLRDETFEAEFVTATGVKRVAVVASRVLRHASGVVLGALQVITDVTANRAIEHRLVLEIQKMARMAGEDPLTGLPNRRAFDVMMESCVANAPSEPFALLLIDLNDFKPINDLHGHEAGDEALKAFAAKLDSLVRDADFVARIGGDEFAVLLTNADRLAAERAAQRFREGLDLMWSFEGRPIRLWASVGLAHSSDGAESALARADAKMYESKRTEKQVRNPSRRGLA